MPSVEEFQGSEDHEKRSQITKRAADQFVNVVRRDLDVGGEGTVAWFAPGQLLIIGGAETHAGASRLFDALADPSAEMLEDLQVFHRLTCQRASQCKEPLAQMLAAHRLLRVAEVHTEFGWQLMAAAVDGRLDVEALTELQIAWRADETQQLLDGKGRTVAMRSLWIVTESARALPDADQLQQLAKLARSKAREALKSVMASSDDNVKDARAMLPTCYAALAMRDDDAQRQRAVELLRSAGTHDSPEATMAKFAVAILTEPTKVDRQGLAQLVTGRLAGADTVVLAALAARRAEGDMWRTFRANMQDVLGNQPLPGTVVVLVNRLANPALPWIAAR
jgi:hypothetical protein